ncbi:MAG: hypothetical protein VB959_20195, partial [Rhodospirillales bacterium]
DALPILYIFYLPHARTLSCRIQSATARNVFLIWDIIPQITIEYGYSVEIRPPARLEFASRVAILKAWLKPVFSA